MNHKPIDTSINKWINILDGTDVNSSGYNCALCNILTCGNCKDCPLEEYVNNGCSIFWSVRMTYEEKQCMLSILYAIKEEMIKDNVY